MRLGETWQTVTWARRFLYDTLVFKPEILRALVDWMGTERVVLGTDFPFDMSDLHPIASVTDAIADAAARRAILEGNAVRLLARAGYRGAAGKGDSP